MPSAPALGSAFGTRRQANCCRLAHMNMAKDARRATAEAAAAAAARDAKKQQTVVRTKELIDPLIPEFVSSARELGIKPIKGKRFSRYWLVWVVYPARIQGYTTSLKLKVHTNGQWTLEYPGDEVSPVPTAEQLRIGFTEWLRRPASLR